MTKEYNQLKLLSCFEEKLKIQNEKSFLFLSVFVKLEVKIHFVLSLKTILYPITIVQGRYYWDSVHKEMGLSLFIRITGKMIIYKKHFIF